MTPIHSFNLSCNYWGLWSEGPCICGMTPIHSFNLSCDYWGLWSEGPCICGMTPIRSFNLSCNYWGLWDWYLLVQLWAIIIGAHVWGFCHILHFSTLICTRDKHHHSLPPTSWWWGKRNSRNSAGPVCSLRIKTLTEKEGKIILS